MSERCRFTPSTCMDDLCRGSDVGLCGNEDMPEWDNDEEYDEFIAEQMQEYRDAH